MTLEIARKILNQLLIQNIPTLTLLETMMMTKILSDGYEVYAIQKGNVTIMAWIHSDGNVSVKITRW